MESGGPQIFSPCGAHGCLAEESIYRSGSRSKRCKFWGAEELGNELHLSKELREQLGITTFRAEGMDDAAMKRQRRENKARSARQSRERAREASEITEPNGQHLSGLRPTAFDLAVDVHVRGRLITTSKIVDRLQAAFPNESRDTLTRKVNRTCRKFVEAGEYEDHPRDPTKMEPRRVRRRPKSSAVHG